MASLRVYLSAEIKDFQRGMRRAERDLNRFAKKTGKYAMMAGAALTAFGVKSVQMFGKQDEVERELIGTLVSHGDAVESLMPKYMAFARSIQLATRHGDEFTLGLMAQMRNLGVAPDRLEDATKGALGLAQALKMDPATAVKYVALAMQGNFQMLQRYIPALKTATTEAEKLAIVQGLMNRGFAQAEISARSQAGRIDQLKNAFGDFAESVGLVLNNIFNLDSQTSGLTGKLLDWADKIQKNAPEISYTLRSVFFDVQTELAVVVAKTEFWIGLFRKNFPDAARYAAQTAAEEIKYQFEQALGDTATGKMLGIAKAPLDALVGAGKDLRYLMASMSGENRKAFDILVKASKLPDEFKRLSTGGQIAEAFKFLVDKGLIAEFRDELIGLGKEYTDMIKADLGVDEAQAKLDGIVGALKAAREDLDAAELQRMQEAKDRLANQIKDAQDALAAGTPGLNLGDEIGDEIGDKIGDAIKNSWPDATAAITDEFQRIGLMVGEQAVIDRDTDYLQKQTGYQKQMADYLKTLVGRPQAVPRFA